MQAKNAQKKEKKEISTKILHVVVLIFLDTTCSIGLGVNAFVWGAYGRF